MPIPTDRPELAANGGPKVRARPWPPRRLFGEDEKRAVAAMFDEATESGSQVLGYNGAQEEAYCREFADFLGGGFADGVNSGTNALYASLRALELEPFTEVIVPPITDPGGAMPVALLNCVPVPADAAPGSYSTGAEQIAERITERTSAIVIAHIAGIPIDLDPVVELAASRGIPLVEDCAQSHGATYRGRPTGTFGAIAAFSTMFGKHHASGGQGGLVFTRDEELYWRARRGADRGKPFGLPPGGNVVASLNCNMDELHAAVGRQQLRKLPRIVGRRRELARLIQEGCASRLRMVRLADEPDGVEAAYWFLILRLELEPAGGAKDPFVAALQAEGMPIGGGYWHAPSQAPWWVNRAVFGSSGLPWSSPQYKGDPNREYPIPNAAATEACHFMVSLHEDWSNDDAADLLTALEKVERAFLAGR